MFSNENECSLPNGKVGAAAKWAWHSRLPDAVLLIQMSQKCIGMRILVNAAVKIACVSVQPRQRQHQVVVHLPTMPLLQVTSQLHGFWERLGARRARFGAVCTKVF